MAALIAPEFTKGTIGSHESTNNTSSANEVYASWGVDTEAALKKLESIPISLHCWQGDDVGGFEHEGGTLSGGGIQATGNYPGKARTLEELRQDLDKALSLIPGKHRLNLHAIYADFGGGKAVPRNELTACSFPDLDRLVQRAGPGS